MADLAIACRDVWKSYRIYHQRSDTLKERALAKRNRYEEFWALKGVDLEVSAGTTVGLIGPNGSGKSTLLKTVAQILEPNRGSVVVNGTVSPLLGLGTGFHPELTGRENVYLGGSLLGQSKRDIDSRYDEIVDFSGIEHFIDMPVKNYSTGMYTRLAFALAVSVESEILLVDEVLAVGDEEFQTKCYERIARYRLDGRTIVLVSHGLEAIRTLCQEALWLGDGVIMDFGRSEAVVANYLAAVHDGGSAEEPAPTGRRLGTGEAVITEVQLLDGERVEAPSFRTGDGITIRLHYRSGQGIDGLAAAVAVHRAENLVHVFGQSTSDTDLELSAGDGAIDLTIPTLPLCQGKYVLTVGLHNRKVRNVYDLHDRRYSFLIAGNPDLPKQDGLVQVSGRWTVCSSTVVL